VGIGLRVLQGKHHHHRSVSTREAKTPASICKVVRLFPQSFWRGSTSAHEPRVVSTAVAIPPEEHSCQACSLSNAGNPSVRSVAVLGSL
jgi:hypothetical protein